MYMCKHKYNSSINSIIFLLIKMKNKYSIIKNFATYNKQNNTFLYCLVINSTMKNFIKNKK